MPRARPIARSRRSTAGTRCFHSSTNILPRRLRRGRPEASRRSSSCAPTSLRRPSFLAAPRGRTAGCGSTPPTSITTILPRAARSCARHRLHLRSGWRARSRRGGIERGLRARAGGKNSCRPGQRRSRARQSAARGRCRITSSLHDSGALEEAPMTVDTRTRFDVVPLSKHIGAQIRGLDLREKPDEETIRAVYRAWLDHLVIVFPGQTLSQEDLLRVTGYFGELGELSRPTKYFPKGYSRLLPGIMLISNIRENDEPIGALPDGEMMFHHDMIHAEVPSKATLLYSVEIPSTGGNTLFASGYAAYDTLDPAVRNKLEGRKAIHHYNYGSVQRGDSKGTEAFGECNHPVFRTHEDTGRKAVYVNRLMTVGVEGMPEEESEPLLGAVFDHAEKKEFVYEHVWRLGDLLLWDNRCSSHARTDLPSTERRLMLRTTVKGTVRPY